MAKSKFEKQIMEVTGIFAQQIIEAIRSATLQELISLQAGESPKKPGRKPGPKPGRKPGRKPGPKPGAKKALAEAVAKKRVVKNYPKCAYPRCRRNRFVRGKGFCGKHWKMYLAGEIKSAEYYKKK